MVLPEVTAFSFNLATQHDEIQTSTIRVVTLKGNPWFVGADILHVLYGRADGQSHVYDCIGPDEVQSVKPIHFNLGKGSARKLISESGLYKLIMRSDKPQAKAFQDWVTKEVLPSIRKTGSYSIHPEPKQLPLLDKPKSVPTGDRLEAIGVEWSRSGPGAGPEGALGQGTAGGCGGKTHLSQLSGLSASPEATT